MSVRRILLFVSLLFCLFGTVLGAIVPSRIAVLNNRTVPNNEVLQMLGIERGKEISDAELLKAIERVKSSGYFSEVIYNFDEASRVLTVQLQEFPVVNVEVVFDGPKVVEKGDLEAKSVIKSGRPMNPSKLFFDIPRTVEAMEELLMEKGYTQPFVTVVWETDKNRADIISGNVTDKIKVTFTVKVSFLWDVTIDAGISDDGEKYLLERAGLNTLKKYYDTSPLIRWVNTKKKYVPTIDDINRAIQAVYSTFYANPNGQWGFDEKTYQAMVIAFNNTLKNLRQVALPENVKETRALSMRIVIIPVEYVAAPFSLKSVFIEGNVNLAKGEILNATGLVEGQTIDNETAARTTQAVQDLYTGKGYPFIRIQPIIDSKLGFFSLKITEPIVRDVKVSFDGTQKTQDYLIGDKIVIRKGEVLSLDELRNTYAYLNSTGYFSRVDINPVPVENDNIDVEITLEESNKNNKIGGGGGWQNGLNVYLDLGLLNVWGYGQKISTNLNVTLPLPNNKEVVVTDGATETTRRSASLDTTISYSIPKIVGSKIDLDTSFKLKFSGFTKTIDSTETIVNNRSQETEFLFSLTPIYNFTPGQSVGIMAGYEYIRMISQIATETKITSATETGQSLESFDGLFTGINYRLSTRDDLFRPTTGSEFLSSLTLRGLFGKDNKLFLAAAVEYRNFMSLEKPVLGFRLKTEQLFPLSPFGVYGSYLLSPDLYVRVRGSQGIAQNAYGVTVGSAQLRYPLTPEKYSIPVDIVGFGDLVFYRQAAGGDIIGGKFVADFGLCLDISVPMIGIVRLGYGYNTYLANQNSIAGKPYYGTPFFGFGPAF